MKKFNVFLIACLAFMFLTSSGCSKDEDSPYSREQIVGKWVENSYMEVDKHGNETWIEIPESKRYFYQFNAKAKDPFSDRIIDYVFDIYSITNSELITNVNSSSSNMRKFKYKKEV